MRKQQQQQQQQQSNTPIPKLSEKDLNVSMMTNHERDALMAECPIGLVPDEVLLRIFLYLKPNQLEQAIRVSSQWRQVGGGPCVKIIQLNCLLPYNIGRQG